MRQTKIEINAPNAKNDMPIKYVSMNVNTVLSQINSANLFITAYILMSKALIHIKAIAPITNKCQRTNDRCNNASYHKS